eukprot:10063885-Alexandrium_andersonii.AAC.1
MNITTSKKQVVKKPGASESASSLAPPASLASPAKLQVGPAKTKAKATSGVKMGHLKDMAKQPPQTEK